MKRITFVAGLSFWLCLGALIALFHSASAAGENPELLEDFWSQGWEFTFSPDNQKTLPRDDDWRPTLKPVNPTGWNGNDALWLRHKLPTPEELQHLARPTLLLPIVDQGVEIFTDEGKRVFSSGISATGELVFTAYPYIKVPLLQALGSKTLVFRVLSDHTNIGLTGVITIQEPEVALENILYADIFPIVIGTILAIMGLFLVPFYWQNRRDTSTLFYGIFIASVGIYVVSTTNLARYLVTLETNLARHWIEIISLYIGGFGYTAYCDSVFFTPRGVNWVRRFVVIPYVAFSVISVLLSVFGLVSTTQMFPIWQPFSLMVIALSFPIHAIRERNPEAIAFVLGFILSGIGFSLGILSALLVIPRTVAPVAITVGITGIAASMGYVIIHRYRDMNRKVRIYANDLEAKNAQLHELDRMKDQFLANTSHELRTPIVGILGIAESLIAGAAGEVNPKIRRYLDLIMLSTRRLTNLVNDILDFSKMRESHIVLRIEPVNLYDMAALAVATCTPLLGHKEIALQNMVPDSLPLAEGDPARVQQILVNLLGNAIKFTESGHVTLSAAEEQGKLRITVADTGVGIPEEHHQRIFQEFEQGDASTTRKYGGSGLGLAITKHLVELQGGAIFFTSEVNRGSCFTFTMPRSQSTEGSARGAGSSMLLATATGNSMIGGQTQPVNVGAIQQRSEQILVVDDEHINREVLQSQLALGGFKATLAASGDEALKILREGFSADLVVLDVMMPGLSGYDVCREIRGSHSRSELPIIFVTAKNQLSNLVEGFSAGGNDYLAKPFLHGELLARIDTQLQLAHFATAVRRAHDRSARALKTTQAIMTRGDHIAVVAEGCSGIVSALVGDATNSSVACHAFLANPPGHLHGLQFMLVHPQGATSKADIALDSAVISVPQMHTIHHAVSQVAWLPVESNPIPTPESSWVWNQSLTLCLMQGERFIGLVEISIQRVDNINEEDKQFICAIQDAITLGLSGLCGPQGKLISELPFA